MQITYDSQDYEPGDYTQDLMLESNDPNHLEFIIANTMHVYIPAQFAGIVYDNDDSDPITGCNRNSRSIPDNHRMTKVNYSLYVDEGTYDVVFEKLGYMTVTVADTFALQGVDHPDQYRYVG